MLLMAAWSRWKVGCAVGIVGDIAVANTGTGTQELWLPRYWRMFRRLQGFRAKFTNLGSSERLAGAGGFEPPNAGIKIRCLTTWRRPNVRLLAGDGETSCAPSARQRRITRNRAIFQHRNALKHSGNHARGKYLAPPLGVHVEQRRRAGAHLRKRAFHRVRQLRRVLDRFSKTVAAFGDLLEGRRRVEVLDRHDIRL